MKNLHLISFILVVVGALNWGLIALMDINLVTMVLGDGQLAMITYLLVGVSAVYHLFSHKSYCKICMEMMKK